jgi:hypothetical protein
MIAKLATFPLVTSVVIPSHPQQYLQMVIQPSVYVLRSSLCPLSVSDNRQSHTSSNRLTPSTLQHPWHASHKQNTYQYLPCLSSLFPTFHQASSFLPGVLIPLPFPMLYSMFSLGLLTFCLLYYISILPISVKTNLEMGLVVGKRFEHLKSETQRITYLNYLIPETYDYANHGKYLCLVKI